MYTLQSSLINQPIVSLQTGQAVAWVGQPILDLANLEVIAFTCRMASSRHQVLITAADVRQYATDCIIIDSEDELTAPNDIVRINKESSRQCSLIGIQVVADTGRLVGIVDDYGINLDTNRVHRLYIKQSFWRSWFAPNVIIDRTQIIDISPAKITVRDSTQQDTVISPKQVPEIHP